MTRMVRGKVIVEGHDVEEEDIETTLSSAAESFAGETTEPILEEAWEEENPLRDGPTFAPPTAPWVGAERAWRLGMTGRVNKEWRYYPRVDDREEVTQTDFALSDDEMAAVLSSVPPPASETHATKKSRGVARVLQYIGGTALITAAVAAVFVVAQSVRPSPKRPAPASSTLEVEPDIAALSAAAEAPSRLTAMVNEGLREAQAENAASPQAPVENMTFTAAELFPVAKSREAKETESSKPLKEVAENTKPIVSTEMSDLASAELEASADQLVAFNLENPYAGADPKIKGAAAEVTATEASSAVEISEGAKPLSRDIVASVMDRIASDVIACANGRQGRIVIRFVVSGRTGRVREAVAAYAPFVDTPIGRCAARAVKQAEFPRFNESEMTIKYPFDL